MTYRPNVVYKAERGRLLNKRVYLTKVLSYCDYSYFTKQELSTLTQRERLMLSRGTIQIKICGGCRFGYLECRRKIQRFQVVNIKRFGHAFYCGYCRARVPVPDEELEKRKMLALVAGRKQGD